jgi:hypothetical protein
MAESAFQLVPFDPPAAAAQIRGQVAVHRPPSTTASTLQLTMVVQTPTDLVLPPLGAPERRDGLWQHTCLELFLAVAGEQPYWEFNLSPDGSWNVYRLEAYRSGLRADEDIQSLPFRCHHQPGRLSLEMGCTLPAGLQAAGSLEWNATAVLEHAGGHLSTWALQHPPEAADFHRRSHWCSSALL